MIRTLTCTIHDLAKHGNTLATHGQSAHDACPCWSPGPRVSSRARTALRLHLAQIGHKMRLRRRRPSPLTPWQCFCKDLYLWRWLSLTCSFGQDFGCWGPLASVPPKHTPAGGLYRVGVLCCAVLRCASRGVALLSADAPYRARSVAASHRTLLLFDHGWHAKRRCVDMAKIADCLAVRGIITVLYSQLACQTFLLLSSPFSETILHLQYSRSVQYSQ